MDWKKAKQEYITTDTSYSELARKYKISKARIAQVGKAEKWVEAKKSFCEKSLQKSLNLAQENAVDYKSEIYKLAYKVALQLQDMTDNSTLSDLALIGIKPRDITGAIKDLEDTLHIKSAKDLEEQQARIEKLRKEVKEEDDSRKIEVVIADGLEEYSS